MDFAASTFEIKALDDAGHIAGVAAGFGNVDHGGDKMLFGSVTKTLAERGARPLPMLLHHDHKRPIGAWNEWQERPEGLYVKGRLTLATADAQEAHALAKDGALGGLSIGYKVRDARHEREARVLTDVELFEASLVTIPMNDNARVTAVKDWNGPAALEQALREIGLSGRWAKEGSFALWRLKHKQSDEAAADAELAALIRNATARLAKGGR